MSKRAKPIQHERLVDLRFPGSAPLVERGVVQAGIFLRLPGWSRALSGTACHHLIFTIAGQARVHAETRAWELKANDLWMFPADNGCRVSVARGAWSAMWFQVEGARWNHLRGLGPQRRYEGQALRMTHVMEGLMGEVVSPCADRAQMGWHFAAALGVFLDRRLYGTDDPGIGRARRELAELWSQVGEDLARPWTVGDLASRLHLSVSHFHRVVRVCNRASPAGILRRMRIQRAQELLAHTDARLDHISRLVGYETPFALSKAFKKQTGLSPRAYCKRNRLKRPAAVR